MPPNNSELRSAISATTNHFYCLLTWPKVAAKQAPVSQVSNSPSPLEMAERPAESGKKII